MMRLLLFWAPPVPAACALYCSGWAIPMAARSLDKLEQLARIKEEQA